MLVGADVDLSLAGAAAVSLLECGAHGLWRPGVSCVPLPVAACLPDAPVAAQHVRANQECPFLTTVKLSMLTLHYNEAACEIQLRTQGKGMTVPGDG